MLQAGRYADALRLYSIALETDSNDAKLLSNRALVQLKLGNAQEARDMRRIADVHSLRIIRPGQSWTR